MSQDWQTDAIAYNERGRKSKPTVSKFMSEALIAEIYNAFNPYPLTLKEADRKLYVDCNAVRGEENIIRQLGKKIIKSNQNTYQLYAGHRGGGKTTELYRLQHKLEQTGYFVIYCAADLDLDVNDVQYTDILLACTRAILSGLKEYSDIDWFEEYLQTRWTFLKDLALVAMRVDKSSIDFQIPILGKLTKTLKNVPSRREEIRKRVDVEMPSLIDSLNQLIRESKKKLPDGKTKIVVIVDNLDRIPPNTINEKEGKTNHDEIFIDRSNLLQKLDCHAIYTVPISFIYSRQANLAADLYGFPEVLPMIKVRDRDNNAHILGIAKLKDILSKRILQFDAAQGLSLEKDIFENADLTNKICEMTGGQVRELMHFMQMVLDWTDELPIREKAVKRTLSQYRNNYRNTVDEKDWIKLAEVSQTKQIVNEQDYRDLLFRRCILEYAELAPDDGLEKWYDVHPLLKETEEFQKALEEFKENEFNTHSLIQKNSESQEKFSPLTLSYSKIRIDNTVRESLEHISELYQNYLEQDNYVKVAETANSAYEMLEKISNSLDERDPSYSELIALSEYWRLTRDLYTSRSK